ncbi:MAG TPA: YgiQ family radical SAM protein, partial [Planctomycetota bacterium]|nr:YgiQ family radical SAM protein [Planctomycetota bacterium]
MAFLYTTTGELRRNGLAELDVVIVSGDAYVDHPSFGAAMIGRALEADGFSVGIIAQPDWRSPDDFRRLGRPRLFFGVTAGNVDSMLAHYTVARKLRRDDAYSPGGKAGRRPNRAAIVYSNRIREAFPGAPVVLGGIEASLRRLAHYDYWEDKIRRSILLDAKADLLVYGMGEAQIVEIARRLRDGQPVDSITDVPGTVYSCSARDAASDPAKFGESITIPSFEECAADPAKFGEAFKITYEHQDPFFGRAIIQRHGDGPAARLVVQNPPAKPLTTAELDRLHRLQFERRWHPSCDAQGGVPALETVRFSITSHRGCYGDCSFCALTFHQGRVVQSRSRESIIREIERLKALPEWRGVVSDIGGPTANMYMTGCKRIRGGLQPANVFVRTSHSRLIESSAQPSEPTGPVAPASRRPCSRRCLISRTGESRICPNLRTDAGPLIELLRAARSVPGVRKVFTGTGVRYDLCLADPDDRYLRELCEHHVSGRLRVAPEHVSEGVLRLMGKPGIEQFEEFRQRFDRINRELGKRQFIVCYFMSSHPGCGPGEMRELADYLRRTGLHPE